MKIIYLLGRGRSGSTLLSHLLGAQKNIVNVGELKNFREYHLKENKKDTVCADGILLREHPFWMAVRAYLKEYAGEEFPDLKAKDPEVFKRANLSIYQAIVKIANVEVIVDASKKLSQVWKLKKILRNDLKTIFLVKDPRAYALSVKKSNIRKSSKGKGKDNIAGKLIWWNLYNLFIYILHLLNFLEFHLVKYEQFANHPEKTLLEIYRYAGLSAPKIELNMRFKDQPAFSGNILFLENKPLNIQLNYAKLENMPSLRWFWITLLTFPSILLYKYPLSRSRYVKKEVLKMEQKDVENPI